MIAATTDVIAVAAGGFLSSAHCIGMCGGFAGAIGAAKAPFVPLFLRQLVYNLGRVFTYAFLGAVAGSAGLHLSRLPLGPVSAPQVFSILAGVLMVGLGLNSLGLLRLPARWSAGIGSLFAPIFNYFLNARGWWGYFAAGLANGFLPCGLVYAFLVLAAATGAALSGSLVMVAFGLGTIPAMLMVGCGTQLVSHATRRRVLRIAAALIVVMGAVTVYRGWPSRAAACCEEQELSRVTG